MGVAHIVGCLHVVGMGDVDTSWSPGFCSRKGAELETFGVQPLWPTSPNGFSQELPSRTSYILGGMKQGTGWGRWVC